MKKKSIILCLSFFLLTLSLVKSSFVFAVGQSPDGGSCRTHGECQSGKCVDLVCQSSSADNASAIDSTNNYADTSDVEIKLADYLTLSDGQKVSDVFAKPSDLINLIVKVVFAGAGIILFAMVILSGLSMIAGAKGKTLDKAKTTMTSAMIGFGIMFAAYWILQIITLLTGAELGF